MKLLDHLEEWLIASLMGAATLLIFVAIVHRYLSGLPIPGVQDWLISLNLSWAQELCIIMFVWMAKFGAAYGVRTGIHVGVDVVLNRLRTPWRNRLIVFGLLAGALFTGTIGTFGVLLILHTAPDQTTEVMELPTRWVYLALPLSSYLMCVRFLQVTHAFIRTGALPKHDPAHVAGMEDEAVGGAA
jgi:C4-dicarboxylate transporter DctQ subunit